MELVKNGKLNPELGLSVGGYLDLSGTEITSLPDGLSVGGYLDLSGTAITNYPVVYNCGNEERSIYLDLEDKDIIIIGCFTGSKNEAIQAISSKYSGVDKDNYISKVEECFKIWEDMK